MNSPHTLGTEQFEASGVDAAEQYDRHASIHLHDERRDERHGHIDFSSREGRVDVGGFHFDILDLGKALGLKQPFGDVLRCDAF